MQEICSFQFSRSQKNDKKQLAKWPYKTHSSKFWKFQQGWTCNRIHKHPISLGSCGMFHQIYFFHVTCEPEGISQKHRELASKFGAKCGKALPGKRRQNKMEFMQQGQSSIYWARVPKAHCRCNLFIRNQKGQADRLSVVLSPMLSPKRYQRSKPTLCLFGLHKT